LGLNIAVVLDVTLSSILFKFYVCGWVDIGHLDDPIVGGRIILKWIFRKWDVGGMDWIDLARDRDRWRELVNAVMNLRVP